MTWRSGTGPDPSIGTSALTKPRDIYTTDIPTGWLPWGALAPVLCLLFVICAMLGAESLLEPFIRMDGRGNPVDATGLMAFTILPFGLLLVLVLGWTHFIEGRLPDSIGLTGDRKVGAFLRGHVIGMAGILMIVAVIWLAGGFAPAAGARAWSSPAALLSIALLLPCFALQSSVEELLFRGWLLSVLSKKFNVLAGVILSSGLFSLLHFNRGQHPLVTVTDFLFGLFCCCWALRSRGILGVMGWHSGWNWLLAVGFGLPLTGLDVGIPSLLVDLRSAGPFWLAGGTEGPEGSVVCVVYFIAGILWLLFSPKGGAART